MKSMNVKRIAAVASGAALVGAALAGAVSVDTNGLAGFSLYSGGEPQVKVVIGGKSQPSDAVVGANIAAMLGNLAYVDKNLEVQGVSGLACTGAATGCAVDDSSKKVSLSVTVPGVSSANAYLMKTYILDNLDSQSEITKDSTTTFDGQISSIQGSSKLVTKDHTAVLKLPNSGKISNPKNLNVVQEQKVYLFSKTRYDESTDYKQVIAQDPRAIYSTTFSDPIPVCWDTSKNRSGSDVCQDSDKVEKSHTKINFLGKTWVITGYALTVANGTTLKSITLGQETAYSPYMNIDDEITASNGAKVKLKSVSPFGYGGSNVPYASFEVTSASGTVTTETLQTDEEKEVAGVVLKVNKVFPGVNNVNYADVSLYSEKLTLDNNVQIDSTTHKYWYASVATSTVGSSVALANLSLYSTGDPAKQKFKAGDSYTLIRGTEAFKFSYDGLDSVTTDSLSFNVGNNTLYTNATASVAGRFVQITSTISNAFQFGSVSTSTIYVALQNGSSASGGATAPAVHNGTFGPATYYYQNPTTGYYVATTGNVTYYYSASETTNLGVTGNNTRAFVWLKEYNEDNQAGV
ncbi:MAG: S-layer protein, partial [Candidatus Micrarchaeia archaeon]